MRSMSLMSRILLPVIILIIIGIAASGLLSSRTTSNIIHKIISEELDDTTGSISTQIGRWITDLKKKHQTLSEMPSIRNLLLKPASDLQQDNEQTNKDIINFIKRFDDFESALLFNKEGLVVAASIPQLVGKIDSKDQEDLNYFKKARQGERGLSDIIASKVTGEPVFAIATPIIDNGKIIGILGAAVSMTKFSQETISPIKIGNEGYAFLADSTGLVAAHPNSDLILKSNLNNYDWGQKMTAQKNGSFIYTQNDIEKFISFRTEPVTGWLVATEAETNDIFGPIRELNIRSGLIGVVVVILLIVTIILLIRPVVAAIKNGVNFANKIKSGDLSNRMCLPRTDEIGALATALDGMADSLQQRAKLAEAIANGDLTQEVLLSSEQDVFGLALRSMTGKLNEILGKISLASKQIDSGSSQVSDSAQNLSLGSTEQASAIEEIGASLNELASRTQTNAENAFAANQLASAASNAANEGNNQMQQMVVAMQEINESGQSISKIIKTIDEIAFQTNLLALNAAVEAARAGQHGKGFAVVAEEVRNLAARSAKAAQETAELIEETVRKGENGAQIAYRTSKSLEDIVNGISKTTDLVAEIAAASQDQANGIREVNDGLTQVDQVVQRNTAGAEESAAAAEELSCQSDYLRQLIGQFRLKMQSDQRPIAQNASNESLHHLPLITESNTDDDGGQRMDTRYAANLD